MTLKVMVHQMSFGQDENGKEGLVFTSEQNEYCNQSVLYTIPIIDRFPFHHPYDLIDYFESIRIVFPFHLKEKYYELEGKINFPDVIFKIPNSEIKINFEIDSDIFLNWHFFRFGRKRYRKLTYIGKDKHLIVDNSGFIILQPVDLYEMDELFLNHRGVFVGFTPNFGNERDKTEN